MRLQNRSWYKRFDLKRLRPHFIHVVNIVRCSPLPCVTSDPQCSFLSPLILKLPKGIRAVERVGHRHRFHLYAQIYPIGIAYTWTPTTSEGMRNYNFSSVMPWNHLSLKVCSVHILWWFGYRNHVSLNFYSIAVLRHASRTDVTVLKLAHQMEFPSELR